MAISSQIFKSSVSKGIHFAIKNLKLNFEINSNYLNNLAFHNTIHTQEVINITEFLLLQVKALNPNLVSEKDILLAQLAAAFHDVVQEWKSDEVQADKFKKIMRIRYVPGFIENERKSAMKAEEFMRGENSLQAKEVFAENDIKLVKEAINATFSFFDSKEKTFVRPNMVRSTSIVARCVALADLNKSGLDPAGSFSDGDNYFKEINLDILMELKNGEIPSRKMRKFIMDRIISWSEGQISFIEGRDRLLTEELKGAPDELMQVIKNTFTETKMSKSFAQEMLERRLKLNYDDLMKDLGYTI